MKCFFSPTGEVQSDAPYLKARNELVSWLRWSLARLIESSLNTKQWPETARKWFNQSFTTLKISLASSHVAIDSCSRLSITLKGKNPRRALRQEVWPQVQVKMRERWKSKRSRRSTRNSAIGYLPSMSWAKNEQAIPQQEPLQPPKECRTRWRAQLISSTPTERPTSHLSRIAESGWRRFLQNRRKKTPRTHCQTTWYGGQSTIEQKCLKEQTCIWPRPCTQPKWL